MSLEFFKFSTILTHRESKQMCFEIRILLALLSINAMHPVRVSAASSSIEQFKLSSLVQTLLLEYQIHFPPILICLKCIEYINYCCMQILRAITNNLKVRKTAKIRKRYNHVLHLTQNTALESNKDTINITNKSREVSPFPAGESIGQVK